jgi:hypothetical protein
MAQDPREPTQQQPPLPFGEVGQDQGEAAREHVI